MVKHTEIIFIIDKSGSMGHLADDTIGGFNSFIESQKDDTKTTLTTVLFDSSWKILHDGLDIYEVSPMTNKDYIPGGMTAMLDAIGETINRVQDRHDDLGEEKPDNVLFVITTDGQENSSRNFQKSHIERMIKHQTKSHGWEFIFLGANMDAVEEAASIGISAEKSITYNYDSTGVRSTYTTMACAANTIKSNATLNDFNLSEVYNQSTTATINTLNK